MWFDTVVLFIGGIVMFFAGIIYSEDLWGLCIGSLFTALLAPFVAYVTNLPIYAFGELVENRYYHSRKDFFGECRNS